MADSDEKLQANTYIWSQSPDQVTISFLVPEACKSRDLDIVIEHQHVRAGLKGQEPVLKGKLFAPVNHFESLWQIEKNAMSPMSSLATSPSLSIASSYALLSTPNHSPNSSMILPAPALAESTSNNDPSSQLADDIYQQTAGLGSSSSLTDEPATAPASPVIHTPPHQSTDSSSHNGEKYRILTIHLEKEQEGMDWAVPISKGWQTDLDIDPTSAYHLGEWFESRMKDYDNAFRYYQSGADRGHTASMVKVAVLYEMDKPENVKLEKDPKKAFEWYRKAADAERKSTGTHTSNGPDALACYIVGTMYGAGSEDAGVEKNYEMALYYFNRTMNITAPRIDIDFGVVHSSTHIEVSPDKALRYWKEAALLGHAQASYNIGIMYANGMGVTADLFEAGKWFSRATKLDTTGKLVVPDGVKAVDWDATPEKQKAQEEAAAAAAAASGSSSASRSGDKARRTRKKKRSKRAAKREHDDTLLGYLLGIGAVVALAGTAWWVFKRSTRQLE
ncbi:hypothetical protein BCR43DRAFT_97785 [Syncephalastrum racemosum]|uniref:CS domain-containing protein n=1 Tax=Syncephalastrum racemosum TaxID=13706 RepID=A0A1X2H1B7_SYNRA|nr:hypothetical protein BCR43DRAFT_97785 [Syncephalastrum racemosum]